METFYKDASTQTVPDLREGGENGCSMGPGGLASKVVGTANAHITGFRPCRKKYPERFYIWTVGTA